MHQVSGNWYGLNVLIVLVAFFAGLALVFIILVFNVSLTRRCNSASFAHNARCHAQSRVVAIAKDQDAINQSERDYGTFSNLTNERVITACF